MGGVPHEKDDGSGQGKRNGYGCGYDAAVRISVIFGGAKKERLVRPEGVEPPTYWFVASCSIQLSYGRTLQGMQPFKDNGIYCLEQTVWT
jgi:hypothetical protein